GFTDRSFRRGVAPGRAACGSPDRSARTAARPRRGGGERADRECVDGWTAMDQAERSEPVARYAATARRDPGGVQRDAAGGCAAGARVAARDAGDLPALLRAGLPRGGFLPVPSVRARPVSAGA